MNSPYRTAFVAAPRHSGYADQFAVLVEQQCNEFARQGYDVVSIVMMPESESNRAGDFAYTFTHGVLITARERQTESSVAPDSPRCFFTEFEELIRRKIEEEDRQSDADGGGW